MSVRETLASTEMNFRGQRYNIGKTPLLDAESDRLSTVYTSMNDDPPPEESGVKKFFGATGPTMFNSFQRKSQGHVNPAFQQDDEENDTDDNLSNPECQSSTENSDTEEETTHDDSSQRISEDYSTEKEPVGNGHIAHDGKDFKVGFGDIEEKSRPPPESEIHQRRSKIKKPKSWDKFTVTSKDNVSNSDIKFWDKVFVVTKLVMCFILFVLTLGTAVITKLCFLIITANIYPSHYRDENYNLTTMYGLLRYKPPNTNVQWIWALIMMGGAPYFFTSLKCLWRLLFQMAGRGTPSFTVILAVLGIETIHSVGLNIMMFIIIPNLDPLSGLMMTLCVGVVPAWLKIFYPTVGPTTKLSEDDRNKPTLLRSTMITVVSVIGACGQLAAIGLWVYHVYLSHSEFELPYIVCLIVAPIFTSVYWWENYIYEGKKDSSGVPLLARHMRKCRTKLTLYASVWKTIITIIIPFAVFGLKCKDQTTDCINTLFFKTEAATLNSPIEHVELTSTKNVNGCNNYLPLVIAAIGILCSGVCFKVAKVACKIMTQIVDYSLPLMLSTPATFGIIIGFYYKFIPTECSIPFPTWADDSGFQKLISLDSDNIFQRFNFIAGICGFFSLLLVTNHIWTPGKERLQTTDRLFVQPLYCGIFFDQSMMLNRRRIEKAKSADTVKNKVTKIPLPDEMKDDDKGERSIFRTMETPMIYMCATMWHESENEMTQLLKSIFRMDEDQCTRKYAQFLVGRRDPDYYEFEAHIFFDDAFEGHKDDEYNFTVNEYVKLLLKTVKVSASSVHGVNYNINPPVKIATPYGGRLVWTLPGGNKLIAHLKDKALIRHRKRWSQVMYMYYFLGYELFNKNLKRKQLQKRAENTFLLALDGDVDFHPQAVQLLVDRMRKNPDVGAACGRIHPIGNGAMVWYQKFEYAVSHWLQKAAEDKFGCVLCSPGCFSLFRGSSLMDENVMAKYTTPPTEPRHYVQYDQGEDRWLCTLLLQQGHRVEYCAASDALTYAPEGFYEFFNQRRRWTPSTMANILDLLTDWKNVTKKNAEITFAYVLYQGLLMVSSILTPGTIFLMILGAINLAYPEVELWVALVINALPVAIMVFLCFKAKSDTQLTYAAILSTAYSLIMMIVIVGLLRQAAMYGMCSVTTVFLLFVAGVFVLAAFLHPQEFWCIIHGFLYFLAIPSMSMILMIYALGNLHVVSWGTRENKTAAEQQADKKDSKVSGFLSMFSGCCPWGNIVTQREDDKLRAILDRLDGVESGLRDLSTLGSNRSFGNRSFGNSLSVRSGSPVLMGKEEPAIPFTDIEHMFSGASNKANPIFAEEKQQHRDRMVNPYWCEEDPDIRVLQQDSISMDESQFWRELIEEYLKPLDADKNKEKEVQAQLIELRNKVCLIFILINSLFIIIVFSLQQVVSSDGSLSIKLPCPNSESNIGNKGDNIEPISVAFTLVFGILLFVQFICMLMHRMATLLHICASTEIFKKKRKIQMPGMGVEEGEAAEKPAAKAEMSYEQVYELVRDMQKDQDADTASLTSESSFGGQSEADEDEAAENRRKTQRERWKKLARQRRRINNRTLGANFMRNLERIQSVMRDSNKPEGDGENEITEEDEIKEWKKKTHFNRMRNKSIHVIAMMAKDPKMKENISRKQIIREQIIKEKKKDLIRKQWEQLVKREKLNQTDVDGVVSQRPKKTSMTNITEALLAKKREDEARQALQDVIEAESPALSRRNVDVHAEDTEQNDDDMYAKVNDVRDESDSDKESESPKESENEDEEEHGATFQLEIPKVEDDQWPDEENYAQVQDKIDVLF